MKYTSHCFPFRPSNRNNVTPIIQKQKKKDAFHLEPFFLAFIVLAINRIPKVRPYCVVRTWEEPAVEQYQSRGELLTNFQGHWSIQIFPENKAPRDWSIRISPEIHMDPWLQNLSESSGLHLHRSIECSSLRTPCVPYLKHSDHFHCRQKKKRNT